MAGVWPGQGHATTLTRVDPSSHFSFHLFFFYAFLPTSRNHISLSGFCCCVVFVTPPQLSSLQLHFNQIVGVDGYCFSNLILSKRSSANCDLWLCCLSAINMKVHLSSRLLGVDRMHLNAHLNTFFVWPECKDRPSKLLVSEILNGNILLLSVQLFSSFWHWFTNQLQHFPTKSRLISKYK